MTKLLIFSLMLAPVLFARDSPSDRRCRDIGGSISTNFTDSTDTLGSATGDLAGGLGVHVLSVTNGANGTTILHNHHHWVTVQGDTILFDDADATLYPTPVAGLFAASYLKGVVIIGGTGRFANATGNLTTTYGAVDLTKGQVILRYEGHVCFANSPASDLP